MLDLLTDIELINLYKRKNDNALLELISRYSSIIDKKISIKNVDVSDFEDIKQEALIAFVNAINSYDDKKAILFSTFVSVCLDNAIKNSVAKVYTKKRQMLSQAICLDEDLTSVSVNEGTPEQIYIDNEGYLILLDKINSLLSAFEKDVLFSFLDRKSYDQIGEELLVSAKAVDNALQRIRRKLKTVF